MKTYKEMFNSTYGFPKGTSHTLGEVSKITGYKLSGLKVIYSKGEGAYFSSYQSVRPSVKSPEQWAMARIYSAVMGGRAARIDAAHLTKRVRTSL
jgi:hypothetical protein